MRMKTWIILVLSAVLAGLAVLACMLETPEEETAEDPDLVICVEADGGSEAIRIWKDQEGCYYGFLPGYARMEQVFFVSESRTVAIDGVPVSEKLPAADLECNRAYPLRSVKDGVEMESTLTLLRSGGVPSLYIDVKSGNMEYIHLDKGNEESGNLRLYDDQGKLAYGGGLDSIKARGNTSLAADK